MAFYIFLLFLDGHAVPTLHHNCLLGFSSHPGQSFFFSGQQDLHFICEHPGQPFLYLGQTSQHSLRSGYLSGHSVPAVSRIVLISAINPWTFSSGQISEIWSSRLWHCLHTPSLYQLGNYATPLTLFHPPRDKSR